MATNLNDPVAMRAFRTQQAAKRTVEQLRAVEDALRNQLAEVARYREQAENAFFAKQHGELVNTANFAIHYVSVNRSVRLDLLADSMADLKHYTREE